MSRSERERAGPSVRALLGLVTALAVAIALSAFITLSRSPASGTSAAPLPSATASRLTSAALRIARGSGDPRPLSVLVVRTSHAQALRVATPGDTVAGDLRKPVYLVVMRGDFTYTGPQLGGARPPTGSYLAVTLDPSTLKVLDLGLSRHAPVIPLRSFGPVTRLA